MASSWVKPYCHENHRMLTSLGKYIVQIARFDPAKGIPTVIDSYAEFRRQLDKKAITDTPQLVV